MKRLSNLYERIISLDNLRLADEKARKGKTRTYGVQIHDKNREENLISLHEALLTKTFKTSTYDVFTIYKPKERLIFRLPYFPDRIVHHAIMNILEPIWVKTFTYNTYSCIRGRGIEGCARQVEKIIKNFKGEKLYCLKIDIKKYYPSINHEVTKRLVRRKIKDADLLWLLDEIIDSADGLPIGNYLSQYLSNLYLCYFMHYVNEQLPELVRQSFNLKDKPHIHCVEYADDITFFAESKDILHEVFKRIKDYLENDLKLKIKENYQIFPIAKNNQDKHGRALDYVGYKFYRKQKLMRKNIKKNLCRKAHLLNKKIKQINGILYKQQLAPWLGWAKHSNSIHLLRTILKPNYYETCILR